MKLKLEEVRKMETTKCKQFRTSLGSSGGLKTLCTHNSLKYCGFDNRPRLIRSRHYYRCSWAGFTGADPHYTARVEGPCSRV